MNRTAVAGLTLIVAALLIGIVSVAGLLTGYDRVVLKAVALTRASTANWAISAWQVVTHLGDASVRSFFVIAALAVLVVRRCWRSALVYLAAVAISIAGHSVMKEAFGRTRPTVVPWLDDPASLSYPSGHAAGSMVVLLLGALLIGNRRLVWAALALSTAIGVSRVMLGVHWPSDVVGGWMWGGGVALIGYAIAGRVQRPARRPASA